MVTDQGRIVVAAGTYTVSIGGGQPESGAASIAGTFQVRGSLLLPE
jgi:beta-glucosidase